MGATMLCNIHEEKKLFSVDLVNLSSPPPTHIHINTYINFKSEKHPSSVFTFSTTML
jgi:hypothetical protein